MYELSGFDLTRSNNYFKLCNSVLEFHLSPDVGVVRYCVEMLVEAGEDKTLCFWHLIQL